MSKTSGAEPTLLLTFPSNHDAPRLPTGDRTLVGGKARSLIRLSQAGLPVPPGAVLTTYFFAPWFEIIRASEPWQRGVAALAPASALQDGAAPQPAPESWPSDALAHSCASLTWTARQVEALDSLRAQLAARNGHHTYAVRSSSPDEDLATASFAGLYETCLGVTITDLEQAIRACFASSLDERVVAYKVAHGFDPLKPSLAVVVQEQIDSEVAGVGFSLDPVTNDYDEAVINACWGLGESVVGGLVSPDHFVVDKVDQRIVARRIGSKRTSVWLAPGGGTVNRDGYRSAEPSLDDEQLRELTTAISRIETLYSMPVDIEWAYAKGRLQILQARPITTYVPLPPELLTQPGARRRLYSDVSLSSGLTINAPISPLGLDWMQSLMGTMFQSLIGSSGAGAGASESNESLFRFAGGRMYHSLSDPLWLMSPAKMAKASEDSDALMSAILANIDRDRYRADRRPSWLGMGLLWRVPRALWHLRRVLTNMATSFLRPERSRQRYQQSCDAFEERWAGEVDDSVSLAVLRDRDVRDALQHIVRHDMAALGAGLAALALAQRLAGKGTEARRALADRLTRGFTGNVVVTMGQELFGFAKRLGRDALKDPSALTGRVESRQLPNEILDTWDDFRRHYGRRGPHEMDLASPRYGDDDELIAWQISSMPIDDPAFDPVQAHQRHVVERREAIDTLIEQSGWLRGKLLRHAGRVLECFAGTRDTPKHHTLACFHAMRKRVLAEGEALVHASRLDQAEDVFGLTFDDLERAREDVTLDLRTIRQGRLAFLNELTQRVKQFPLVIDSRGRILRATQPSAEKPGELVGLGVSDGVVTGPIKLLHHPREKPIEKGDILVAYTTDPGWTPLFVNAGAVVLEIGGTLQHGALVAREYGKPCVVGIEGVMERLRDGQQVEVDGGAGRIRVLG